MKKFLIDKKAFELSFSMIFAIIAGAVIIFLAIYATTRFIETSQYASYSESAQSLANILNPMVNGMTSATKAPEINFKKTTRIYLGCQESHYTSPIFGREVLSFSEESGFFKKWSSPGANISRNNKYIFGEKMQEGKSLNIFSKPLYFGYRVDDLVFITMNDYCFVSPPDSIKDEIINLKIKNINISNQIINCKKNSISVCFGFAGNCNISVYSDAGNYGEGRVVKNGKTLNYISGLVYAAIFSSPDIYSCNLKRLGIKSQKLSQIYQEKINLVKVKDCSSQIATELNTLEILSSNLTDIKLNSVYSESQKMDSKNCVSDCPIYASERC